MLEEVYVTFETAALLHDVGFFALNEWYYNEDTKELEEINCNLDDFVKNHIDAPTHQMAVAWLREKGIYIYVQPIKYDNGDLYAFKAVIEDGRDNKWTKYEYIEEFYNAAVETALKYCAKNLIK